MTEKITATVMDARPPAPQAGQIWYIGGRRELHYVMSIDTSDEAASLSYAVYRSLEDFSSRSDIRAASLKEFYRTLQGGAQLVGGPGAPWPSIRESF